jgi:SET domain-containing protein
LVEAENEAGASIQLVALRDIRPDEQLTIDYAWPADSAIPCGCDSPNCRGWVVDADERHLVGPAAP